jgi:hypothetical protein
MRWLSALVIGFGALVAAVWSAPAATSPVVAAQPGAGTSAAGAGGLIALACPAGDNRQQLTVVDPNMKVVGVYHIDTATGDIVLKSVRNIHWDLQMVEFNGGSPSPREIRTLLEQR